MPRVRMSTSIAGEGFAYSFGEEVDMPAERAQQMVTAGWAELVRSEKPEAPERPRGRRVARPETPES
jgi:hypothetical protein